MKWTFDAIRYVVNAKELKQVVNQHGKDGYDLAALKKSGNKIAIAFASSNNTDQFDFATELAHSKYVDSKHTVYIELLNDGQGVFVELESGLPKRARIMDAREIEDEINWLKQEEMLPKKLLAHGQFTLPEINVDWLDLPLSESLTTSTQSCFLPATQALKPQESQKRKMASSFAIVCGVAAAVYLAWPNKNPVYIEDITDVNAPYVRAIHKESIDFHTRMVQLYAFHRLFDREKDNSLAGWGIERVSVGRSATIFKLQPRADMQTANKKELGTDIKPTAGGIQRFISSDDFKEVVGTANFNLTIMSIELQPIHQSIMFNPYSGKFDVRELYHTFSDLVNITMPNADLQFVGDTPESLYITSESKLRVTGAYIEDLVGMGGMMKYHPISFNSANRNDTVIGQYRIDELGRITGEFSLTMIGTKHAIY